MATQVQRRQLGQTDLSITPIGLGVMQFAGGKGFMRFMYPSLSQEEMNAIVAAALAGGINWFDTAEMYGRGHSEQGLAAGLGAAGVGSGEVVVATKWWPLLRTAASIKGTISQRLHNLAPYPIDLHQVHWPYSFSSIEAQMNEMADLVEAGSVRAVGVSNYSAEQMRRAHAALARRSLPLASNQVHYCLLDRSIEQDGILDAARELGITIIAYSPLKSGLLSGKFHDDSGAWAQTPWARRLRLRGLRERSRPLIEVLGQVAEAHGASIAQVSLNWLVHFHGEVVTAIPGASKPHQAGESAGAMQFSLSAAEMARIDEVSREVMG